jgi:hypothetical protein
MHRDDQHEAIRYAPKPEIEMAVQRARAAIEQMKAVEKRAHEVADKAAKMLAALHVEEP